MSLQEITLREMWSRFQSGSLRKSTAIQLSELYNDLENPTESSMQEPTGIRRKGRPPGAKNKNKVDAREKSLFEHREKELKVYEKEKKAKEKTSQSQGRT